MHDVQASLGEQPRAVVQHDAATGMTLEDRLSAAALGVGMRRVLTVETLDSVRAQCRIS